MKFINNQLDSLIFKSSNKKVNKKELKKILDDYILTNI